jgi:hypothetical protein
MPYRRLDNVIDGAVITTVDITATKQVEATLLGHNAWVRPVSRMPPPHATTPRQRVRALPTLPGGQQTSYSSNNAMALTAAGLNASRYGDAAA